MQPDRFAAWVEEHGPSLQRQLGQRYPRANVEDAWQTIMVRLCPEARIQALDESRLPGYLYRAMLKELAQQRRGHEREEKRLKALALLDGCSRPTDDEQVECERILRALPKGALRTAAWLIYACEWALDDAVACVGMTTRQFKRRWRAKAYASARAQLARYVRRTRR